MPSGCTNNFPESGRGLVTSTVFGNTVGYPSDSLAFFFLNNCNRDGYFLFTVCSVMSVLVTKF